MLSRNRRDAKKAPAWLGRAAFTPELTPLEHAVAMAKAAGNNPALPAVLLADVADNPGGGGRGNTPFILRALLKEKVRNAMLGVITDPELSAGANWRVGSFNLGPSALLQIDGVQVVVITNRHQCHEPAFFEIFGVDIASVRTIVVKSRGHFRAAFDEFFNRKQIVNVDAPGLTSPILSRFDFKRLPRPVVPIDALAEWTPQIRLLSKRTPKVAGYEFDEQDYDLFKRYASIKAISVPDAR